MNILLDVNNNLFDEEDEYTPRGPRVYPRRMRVFDQYTDRQLIDRYRFDRNCLNFLTELIEEEIAFPTTRNHAIEPSLQLCIALRLYASNGFQQLVGDASTASKSTACRILHRVTCALLRHMDRFIRFPNAQEAVETKSKFFQDSGLPGIVGIIDGTQIGIQGPGGESDNAYINRKGNYAINVQGTCDHDGAFIDVCARWPGSTHDSRVLRTSSLGQRLESGELTGTLVGDSGYPAKTYLLTPFLTPVNPAQRRYNKGISSIRWRVEQGYGKLKRRWSILKWLRIPTWINHFCIRLRFKSDVGRWIDVNCFKDMEIALFGFSVNLSPIHTYLV